eukprot:GFYU01025588.1.p1 GENE.GFYU01025588.1~~GFYU01025588.1.p1  ORF type:complete len:208 (-),score=1.24 GFYU01025588.1:65-637(-)
MLTAELDVDVCEAATTNAVEKAVLGLGERALGGRGYWVSTSFDRAYGAGLDSTATITVPPHQAPGLKRPRSTTTASHAPPRTSKLGLVAVYYLIASLVGGDDCIAVGNGQNGTTFYKLVPGYTKTSASPMTSPTTPTPTAASQVPTNPPPTPHQQQQQPLSLAAMFPTAVVAPTREMDFVSVLLAFRPKF